MLRLSASTTDDRGRRVPVFVPTSQPRARYDSDPQLREIVQRIAGSNKLGVNEAIDRSRLISLLPFALFPLMFMIVAAATPGLSRWGQWAMGVAGFALIMPFGFALHHRQLADRIRATLLREGRCPSCAYTISTLPLDPDGCMTCPECNAAWKATRVTAPSLAAPRADHNITSRPRAAVADARDRAVSLRHPLLLDLDPQRAAEIEIDRLVRLRVEVSRRTRRPRLAGVLLGTFAALCAAALYTFMTLTTHGFQQLFVVWTGLLFVGASIIFIYRVLTYRSRTTAVPAARVLIADHLCPSCAGDLAPDPAEPALLLCSTCRAAWKPGGP